MIASNACRIKLKSLRVDDSTAFDDSTELSSFPPNCFRILSIDDLRKCLFDTFSPPMLLLSTAPAGQIYSGASLLEFKSISFCLSVNVGKNTDPRTKRGRRLGFIWGFGLSICIIKDSIPFLASSNNSSDISSVIVHQGISLKMLMMCSKGLSAHFLEK